MVVLLQHVEALPKAIRIGALDFSVEEVARLVTDDGRFLQGCITYHTSEIEIKVEMSGQNKIVTLWHEIVHGILDQAGIIDQPETLVTTLGYGIVQVIRDNPELINATVGNFKE